MSTSPRPEFSLSTHLSQETVPWWELPDLRPPPNYTQACRPNPLVQAATMYSHQRCVREHQVLERTHMSDLSQVYIPFYRSAHVNQISFPLPRPNSTQTSPESLRISPSPARAVVEWRDNNMTLAPRIHDPLAGANGSYRDSDRRASFEFSRSWPLEPPPPDRHLLPQRIGPRNIHPQHPLLAEPPIGAGRFISHAIYSHSPIASNHQIVPNSESFTLPPPPPPSFSFPPLCPSLAPTAHVEPDPHFCVVLPQDSASRHQRNPSAIEYGGLWVDKEELLQSLTEENGKLHVHRCLCDVDNSPCHLWIKGDKSCIHTHIQKWHGEKPGGDKLEVICPWSGCRQTMLKESIARHILSIHLGEKWVCQGCGKKNARKDAYGRHVAKSELEGCRTSSALITYSAEVRAIDARAALDSGGRVRYAGE